MEKERLKATLSRLHEALSDADQLDDDLREMLATVDRDIHRVLEEENGAEEEGTADRVREAATRFQARHPRTARILSDLADTLAKLGI